MHAHFTLVEMYTWLSLSGHKCVLSLRTQEPSTKYVTLKGVGCPGKRYRVLHGVGGVLVIVRYYKSFFARPAVNIRLTEYFIAIPFSWYILTEFEWKRNADSTIHF